VVKAPKLLIILIVLFLVIGSVIKMAEIIGRRSLSATVSRKWHLKTLPKEIRKEPFEFLATIDSWREGEDLEVFYKIKDSSISGKMEKSTPKKYKAEIDISSLLPDEYSIYAYSQIKNKREESPEVVFYVSEPICISWTMDWEGWQVPESHLKSLEEQFKDHKNTPLTHFFNPRIFLPSVMEATQWR